MAGRDHTVDTASAARAWINECRAWAALGRVAGDEGVFDVEDRGELVCAWCRGEPRWLGNHLLAQTADPVVLVPLLRGVDDRRAATGASTTLQLLSTSGDDGDDGLEAALQRLTYVPDGGVPLMLRDLADVTPTTRRAPEVEVRRVEDEADHATAVRIARSVYRDPPGLTEFFNPPGAVTMYLGRWEGAPASTATLWPFAGVAGVYSVATLPEFRRRGLASATVAALLEDAKERGLPFAALRTGWDDMPLYERLGFRERGRVLSFRRGTWVMPVEER